MRGTLACASRARAHRPASLQPGTSPGQAAYGWPAKAAARHNAQSRLVSAITHGTLARAVAGLLARHSAVNKSIGHGRHDASPP
eukprot:5502374-Pyramimonas_sp.AAC.1